jgi:hypothetical protein
MIEAEVDRLLEQLWDKLPELKHVDKVKAGNIRIWRLGSLEHKIVPSDEAIVAFKEALQYAHSQNSDGCVDIIWGPDIDVKVVG